MDRRVPLTVASVGFAMALLIAAASSGSIRIWITPIEVRSPAIDEVDPSVIGPQNPVPSDQLALPSWINTLLPFLGALLILLVVVAIASARIERPGTRVGWRQFRWWKTRTITPLPEVAERELTVDVEAARAALSEGSPRNAIIACWVQLESDAAKVGLRRMVAETPAEYVERVVVASSVDAAPIRELAALYREARFSRHKLGDDDRAQALDALHRVAASLRTRHKVSA